MKKWVGFILLGVAQSGIAAVTPAHLAINQVRAFLEPIVESKAERVLPPHMHAHYVLSYDFSIARGKYSQDELGFSDIRGRAEVLYQIGNFEKVYHVTCDIAGRVNVVGFAKQTVPILEEEVNHQQLILSDYDVSCR